MSKYVNVDAFVEALCKTLSTLRKQKDNTPESIAFLKGAQVVAKVLMKFPAADVVEVVRCRECKYSYKDEIFGNRWCDSHLGCRKVKDDGYCYLGERKEGTDND